MEQNQYYYVYVNDEDMKPDVIGGDLRFWDLKRCILMKGKRICSTNGLTKFVLEEQIIDS